VFLSLFTSINFGGSLSSATDLVLEVYVPFLAIVFVVRTYEEVLTLVRATCVCALLVAVAGMIEFKVEHRYFIEIIPTSILASLMEHNPSFAEIVNSSPYRNGLYRASSIFRTSLSFGQFEAMMVPL